MNHSTKLRYSNMTYLIDRELYINWYHYSRTWGSFSDIKYHLSGPVVLFCCCCFFLFNRIIDFSFYFYIYVFEVNRNKEIAKRLSLISNAYVMETHLYIWILLFTYLNNTVQSHQMRHLKLVQLEIYDT